MIIHMVNSSLVFVCGENKKHPERILTGSSDFNKTTCSKCKSIIKQATR